MSDHNKPVDTVRDGNLKASIFCNEGSNGPFFSTELTRTYKDDQGNFQHTNVFSGTELLQVSELARRAYSRSLDLKREITKNPDMLRDNEGRGGRASKDFERQQPDRSRSRRELRR